MSGTRKKKIVQFGIGRSGSTFIYQLLIDIVGKPARYSVEKRHADAHHGDIVVATYRDFRDVLVSRWRVILSEQGRYNEIQTRKMDEGEMKRELTDGSVLLKQIGHLNKVLERGPETTILLKYEEFMENQMIIFDKILPVLDIKLKTELKHKLLEKYSISRNMELAKKFRSFKEWDKKTMIHGHHIYKGEIGTWSNYIPEEYYDMVYDKLREDLIKWGYEIDE